MATPSDVTRVAPRTNAPVAQGGVDVPLNEHPATKYWLWICINALSSTRTRNAGCVGVARPVCEH